MINKEQVKKSFKKCLDTYNQNAVVQKEMAEKIINMLPRKSFDRVLEIGIGTGFLTKLLSKTINYKEFFGNDIVSKCDKYLFENIESGIFLQGDIEEILLPEKLDLVVSNASFQWIEDFSYLSKKISSSIMKDGIFLFSTFGENNFHEIKDLTGISLKYQSKNEIENILKDNFEIISITQEEKNIYFDSFKDLLHHIKNTGVNSVSSEKLSISGLKKFEKNYQKAFKTEKGFLLTYNPIYVCAKKI